jgi:hypothetical protein
MVEDLIQLSNHDESGFICHDELIKIELDQSGQNVILIGVTFALLDLIENISFNCKHHYYGNGGMKGRRKEMIRDELHQQLCKGFGVSAIHSEYGMTGYYHKPIR